MTRRDVVGILASPATNRTGLFRNLLEDADLRSAFPEDETEILASIRRIKKHGPSKADLILLEMGLPRLFARVLRASS